MTLVVNGDVTVEPDSDSRLHILRSEEDTDFIFPSEDVDYIIELLHSIVSDDGYERVQGDGEKHEVFPNLDVESSISSESGSEYFVSEALLLGPCVAWVTRDQHIQSATRNQTLPVESVDSARDILECLRMYLEAEEGRSFDMPE